MKCTCGCGREFYSKRPWHVFYSDECRKKWHKAARLSGVTYDIRATLTRIEAKVDQILAGTK